MTVSPDHNSRGTNVLATHWAADNPLGILGVDFVEVRCANAVVFSHFLCAGLGFRALAERSPISDPTVGYICRIVAQGDVRLAVTSAAIAPRRATRSYATRVAAGIATAAHLEGDTISDIAFTVADVDTAYHTALRRGARSVAPPADRRDHSGLMRRARVASPGAPSSGLVHTLIQRSEYHGAWAPHYVATQWHHADRLSPVGISRLSHVALRVPTHKAVYMAQQYSDQFGFETHPLLCSRDTNSTWLATGPEGSVSIAFDELEGPRRSSKRRQNGYIPRQRTAGGRSSRVAQLALTVIDAESAEQALICRGIGSTEGSDADATLAHFEGRNFRRVASIPIAPRSDSPHLDLIGP
jgi:4-hydroxyphenylpyruvate dioxygenase-like putative hemolysin